MVVTHAHTRSVAQRNNRRTPEAERSRRSCAARLRKPHSCGSSPYTPLAAPPPRVPMPFCLRRRVLPPRVSHAAPTARGRLHERSTACRSTPSRAPGHWYDLFHLLARNVTSGVTRWCRRTTSIAPPYRSRTAVSSCSYTDRRTADQPAQRHGGRSGTEDGATVVGQDMRMGSSTNSMCSWQSQAAAVVRMTPRYE